MQGHIHIQEWGLFLDTETLRYFNSENSLIYSWSRKKRYCLKSFLDGMVDRWKFCPLGTSGVDIADPAVVIIIINQWFHICLLIAINK